MASVEKDGRYMSAATALSSGGEETCYTVPNNKWAHLTSIRAAKNDGTAGTARVVWFITRTSASICLVHNAVIPASGALELELLPLALSAGDEIRVTSAAGVHVIVSGLEEARSGT